MSISTAESELRRARASLEFERKKQAAEEKKAASAEKDAAAKERSASQSKSESSIKSYRASASRKRDEASKARSKAADHSSKVADYQVKVHAAEEKLSKARAAEEKKRTDDAKREEAQQATRAKQDKSRREAEERRQRQEADRLARRAATEQQRADAARAQQDAMIDRRLTQVDRTVTEVAATVEQRPWENVPEKITVLFISALPDCEDPLNIDREVREIQEKVRDSKHRDAITFEFRPATRVLDLVQHLNEVEPDVVHFSGHGEDAGIVLHDRDDQAQLLTGEQLAGLLAIAEKPTKLVVLNSCDSAELARAVVQHATAVIGMEQSIKDETARVFAGQLYNSLGFGRSVGLAFEQAKFQVMLTFDALSGDPTLVMADGVEPGDLVVVSPVER